MDRKKIKSAMSKLLSLVPDKLYCEITFALKHKRLPNLESPELINDKLLVLKLNDRNPILKKMVDKYEVRKYVEDKVGSDLLVPLIGLYKDPDDVNFKDLPNEFVLKPTSGAQQNLICRDKTALDWGQSSKQIRKWINFNSYKRTREWPYKDLPPRFIIEHYIEDSNGETNDYKFWCFNGEPKLVQVDVGRFKNHRRNMYFANDFKQIEDIVISHDKTDYQIRKPNNYAKMIEVARALSKEFKFVRVDLYNIDGKIYFGEMTFYPGNCNEKIVPISYEKIFGNMLNLKSDHKSIGELK